MYHGVLTGKLTFRCAINWSYFVMTLQVECTSMRDVYIQYVYVCSCNLPCDNV